MSTIFLFSNMLTKKKIIESDTFGRSDLKKYTEYLT